MYRVAALLEQSPRVPACEVQTLVGMGVALPDLSHGVLQELSSAGTDHDNPPLDFLISRLACHALEQAQSVECAPSSAQCIRDLGLAHTAGASLSDLVAALQRRPA